VPGGFRRCMDTCTWPCVPLGKKLEDADLLAKNRDPMYRDFVFAYAQLQHEPSFDKPVLLPAEREELHELAAAVFYSGQVRPTCAIWLRTVSSHAVITCVCRSGIGQAPYENRPKTQHYPSRCAQAQAGTLRCLLMRSSEASPVRSRMPAALR